MSRLDFFIEIARQCIQRFEEEMDVPKWRQPHFQDVEDDQSFRFKHFTLECTFGVKRVYGKDKKIVDGKEIVDPIRPFTLDKKHRKK